MASERRASLWQDYADEVPFFLDLRHAEGPCSASDHGDLLLPQVWVTDATHEVSRVG
jgi:hypothetical protein